MISKNNKARLQKQQPKTIEVFLLKHSGIIITILFLLLLIMIGALIVALFGMTSTHAHAITGTEANSYYNHFEEII